MFLGKVVLKICRKFTGKCPCQSVISIKLLYNFIEITLWHGHFPVNLQSTFYKEHLWTATSVNKIANSETAAHWCFKKNVLAGIHFQRS